MDTIITVYKGIQNDFPDSLHWKFRLVLSISILIYHSFYSAVSFNKLHSSMKHLTDCAVYSLIGYKTFIITPRISHLRTRNHYRCYSKLWKISLRILPENKNS